MEQETVFEPILKIDDIHASVLGKPILNGVSLVLKHGEIHVIMGPNGSGKSTLSYVLAGHPKYAVTKGKMLFQGKDIAHLSAHQRAQEGLFLAFQYPAEIPGVTLRHFLYTAYKQKHPDISPLQFKQALQQHMNALGFDPAFLDRPLNVGFSGGEKKRAEVLQLLLLQPTCAVLDETDSGLDIDSLKIIATTLSSLRGPRFSALVITHNPHLLPILKPEKVHVMSMGKIVASGKSDELGQHIEQHGYQQWVNAHEL